MSRRYHYVQHRKVVMDDHGALTVFDDSVTAAAALGITAQQIYQKISIGRPDNKGRIFYYEGEPRKTYARHPVDGRGSLAVVAVSDKGVRVGLRSLRQAALLIGAPMSAIYRMLRERTREFGWRLYAGKVDRDGNISIDSELYSLGELPLSPAVLPPVSCGYAGPELSDGYLYGYIDTEIGPAVCPVCNQVLAMTTEKYVKHFNRCLAGRRWRVLLGGRLEVSPETDPDAEKHVFTLVTR